MFRNEDRKPVAEWRKDGVISAILLLYARKVGQEESASSASVDQGVTAGKQELVQMVTPDERVSRRCKPDLVGNWINVF